ncbi:4Fe-4S double cluster binding domain-containing protein [Bacteroidota bacterium]
MIDEIINKFINKEDFVYGFAEVSGLLSGIYSEYNYGIVIGKRLDKNIIDSINNGPTQTYLDHYKEINQELTTLAIDISRELNKCGILSVPTVPSLAGKKQDADYEKYLSRDISHKMLATRAGLGWIGKTALFISEKFGPRLRLVSILTNTPLNYGQKPVTESRCEDCTICIDACPAQAGNGTLWNTTIHRDIFFNAHKCREMCRVLGKKNIGFDASICGICVSVCPYGD